MQLWVTVVMILFMNSLYGAEGSPRPEDPSTPACEEQMVRKAFSQAQWPDQDHGPMPSQRYYDHTQEKCLTKVDEYCPDVDAHCAPNSECRTINDGGYLKRKCYCSEIGSANGTIGNAEKTYCGTRAGYGEECSDVPPYVACDPQDKLSCHNGNTCGCQYPSKMTYVAKDNRCKLLAGEDCNEDNDCVDDAQCIRPKYEKATCQCPHGASKEGLCYRGFLEECSADRPCNVHNSLKCTDGICRCAEPLHQVFEDEKCVVLIGRKCEGSEGGCVKNGTCVDGICKCDAGFSATSDHHCFQSAKEHGEACDNEECDFNKGLACLDGTCQCIDSTLKLDDHSKNCVAPIGSRCGSFDIVGKGDGKCGKRSEDEDLTYVDKTNTTCPHYYVACHDGRPCIQRDDGESYCT